MGIVLSVEPNWVSPYVFACYVTLLEKGVVFDVRELRADKGDTRDDDYLATTVTGRVPTLVHDAFGLAESSAIVEYLEDVFPNPPVLPSTPRERARARQLMSWLRSDDTMPIRAERPSTTIFHAPPGKSLSDEGKRARDKLVAVSERMLRNHKEHLFDVWSVVDAELAFMLQRLVKGGDEVPPSLASWASAQWVRPSVIAFVERPRPSLA